MSSLHRRAPCVRGRRTSPAAGLPSPLPRRRSVLVGAWGVSLAGPRGAVSKPCMWSSPRWPCNS
eukprot:4704597-Prorocentrum_lima.AAC.1